MSAGLIGGKLYLVGEYSRVVDILDLATGSWSSSPERPYRACDTASATLQARLYLFGFCSSRSS